VKDNAFKDFVLEQLQSLDEVHCRRMFGSYGLYSNGTFFGIVAKARLYLKTNTATQTAYVQRGMQPFRPTPRQTLKTYYEVPVDILEDHEQLVIWARRAIACQLAEEKSRFTAGSP
jgi:DNA transformation protein